MEVDVASNLKQIKDTLPEGVALVAISKYHVAEHVMKAYDAGQRVFGESREQELVEKAQKMPGDIKWHFIGHLQRNKVKYIAPFIEMIHSMDSPRLLAEIDKQAEKCGRKIKVLLQLHIADEETKFGMTLDECRQMLEEGKWREYKNVEICGIMMMASNVDDREQIRGEFQKASDFFDEVKAKYFADSEAFCQRSWGMSHDYDIAVKCNSTMVRVGTAIFGEREY